MIKRFAVLAYRLIVQSPTFALSGRVTAREWGEMSAG